MSCSPFAAHGAVDSGSSVSQRSSLKLRYDPALQRNRILHDGMWLDIASCSEQIGADSFLTMTSHATMTRLAGEVGEGSKLDDDG